MHSQPGWRDDYRKIAAELISSSPEISLPEIADRLAMPADLVADLLDHPMAPILRRWATRGGRAWHRHGLVRARRLTRSGHPQRSCGPAKTHPRSGRDSL